MHTSIQRALLLAAFTTFGATPFATVAQGQPATAPTPAPAAAPATAPAAELKIIDRQVGAGRQVESGRAALLHYTGWLYDDKAPDNKGKQFDASANRGLPFGFIVGVGKVIKGWDQGVLGMKVGGKRTLIIPPQLGYGDKDVGNGLIPPNSTLLFDIELIEVKP